MLDILPKSVIRSIRDRYLAGVADAEAAFEFSEADEDSLSGALGQAISTPTPVTHIVDGRVYKWKIYSRKIRGRGRGAPEKLLGADGIFQIELLDEQGKIIRRKGLPFQAKKRWSSADKKLVGQAESLLASAGSGIMIDFTAKGYTSCSLPSVIEAKGRKKDAIQAGAVTPLGQTLGNEFLECRAGTIGLYYDPEEEDFVELAVPLLQKGAVAVTTTVSRGKL